MSKDGKGMNAFDDVTGDDEPEKEGTDGDDGEVVSKTVDKTTTNTPVKETEEETESVKTPSEDTSPTSSSVSPGIESPSFTHKDVERQSVYIFTETWDAVLDMRFDVRKQIRERAGVRNVDKRELDEAMLTLAMQELDIEDIVDLVIENRRNPP